MLSKRFYRWLLAAAVPAVALLASAAPPNLPRALEAQRELTREQPHDSKAWNDLGNLLALSGDLESAEAAYRRALEIDPAKASALYNLGVLLQQQQRYRAALDVYEQLLELHPGYAWGYYQMGTVQDVLGRDRKATELYAHAFTLDPQLAFPEVNPHVIDNEHFTQALLLAHREPVAGELAPKAYDEPIRITQIMVQPPEEMIPGTGETAADALAENEIPGEETGRVLTEGDLDRESEANQIRGVGAPRRGSYQPPRRINDGRGAAAGRRGVGQPTRNRRGQATTGGTAVIGVPQAQPQNQPQAGEEGEAGRPLTTPRGRIRVRPGTASTGSLGVDLVPDEAPAG